MQGILVHKEPLTVFAVDVIRFVTAVSVVVRVIDILSVDG